MSLAVLCSNATAALPLQQWQRTYGGTNEDRLYCQSSLPDGGYVLGGYSLSGASGSKTETNYGPAGINGDFWLVRLDSDGNKLWDKTYGGSADDRMFALCATPDGGFLLGGFSESQVGGSKSSANWGGKDFWIVKVNASGIQQWDASFGGANDDILFSLQQTTGGGYILGGYSASGVTGNKSSPNYGVAGTDGDFWAIRVATDGAKLWDRTFGGSGDEAIYSLKEIEGGYILAGSSTSPADGTKTSDNRGGYDFWVVSVLSTGKQVWDSSCGGTADDGIYNVRILRTADGGYVLGGDSASGVGGTKTSPAYGSDDYWLLRLDGAGQQVWDRAFGGSGYDQLTDLLQMGDEGFLLAGLSDSGVSGTKTAPSYGASDVWLVRTDSLGTATWDTTYGGTSDDAFYNASVSPVGEGGFLVGCDSRSSTNGNKTAPNIGGRDFWVLRLQEDTPVVLRAHPQTDISRDGFQLFLKGRVNEFYVIEKTSSLQNGSWLPVVTNQLTTSEMEIRDLNAAGSGTWFYRARQWP